jgi:hypothetical protein
VRAGDGIAGNVGAAIIVLTDIDGTGTSALEEGEDWVEAAFSDGLTGCVDASGVGPGS